MLSILEFTSRFIIYLMYLAFIPCAGCFIYGIVKGWWKLAAVQVGVLVAFVGVLFGLSISIGYLERARYFPDLFDVSEVSFDVPVYSWEEERGRNGDGYTLAVFPLPETLRRRFEAADERLLSEFPKRPSYRSKWKTEHWREAPFEADPDFLEFALAYGGYPEQLALRRQWESIRAALTRKRAYYAFFYSGVGDIDFFVVDLGDGKVYLINFNT